MFERSGDWSTPHHPSIVPSLPTEFGSRPDTSVVCADLSILESGRTVGDIKELTSDKCELDAYFEEFESLIESSNVEKLKEASQNLKIWTRFALGQLLQEEDRTCQLSSLCSQLNTCRSNLETKLIEAELKIEKFEIHNEKLTQEISKLMEERDRMIGEKFVLCRQLENMVQAKNNNDMEETQKHCLDILVAENRGLKDQNRNLEMQICSYETNLATTKVKLAAAMEDKERISKLAHYYALHVEKCNPKSIILQKDRNKLDQLQLPDLKKLESSMNQSRQFSQGAGHRGKFRKLKDWALRPREPSPISSHSFLEGPRSPSETGIDSHKSKQNKWNFGHLATHFRLKVGGEADGSSTFKSAPSTARSRELEGDEDLSQVAAIPSSQSDTSLVPSSEQTTQREAVYDVSLQKERMPSSGPPSGLSSDATHSPMPDQESVKYDACQESKKSNNSAFALYSDKRRSAGPLEEKLDEGGRKETTIRTVLSDPASITPDKSQITKSSKPRISHLHGLKLTKRSQSKIKPSPSPGALQDSSTPEAVGATVLVSDLRIASSHFEDYADLNKGTSKEPTKSASNRDD